MLARAHQRCRLLGMNMIGSTDVYDVNLFVFRKFFKGGVSAIQAECTGSLRSSLSGASQYAYDGNALPAQRFNVRPAHEPSSDDRSAQSPCEFPDLCPCADAFVGGHMG